MAPARMAPNPTAMSSLPTPINVALWDFLIGREKNSRLS